MHTLNYNIHTLYINLKLYKLLIEEYLKYNNYTTAKMVDFIQWVNLTKTKMGSGLNHWIKQMGSIMHDTHDDDEAG